MVQLDKINRSHLLVLCICRELRDHYHQLPLICQYNDGFTRFVDADASRATIVTVIYAFVPSITTIACVGGFAFTVVSRL